jgi:poly-gamma-glutamate synthesis protein (capsule biosynthesis protein)
MMRESLRHKIGVLAGALLILGGVGLLIWLLSNRPTSTGQGLSAANAGEPLVEQADGPPTPVPIAVQTPLILTLGDGLPPAVGGAISNTVAAQPGLQLGATGAHLRIDWQADGGSMLYGQTFAVATRFNTVVLSMTLTTLQTAWQGETMGELAIAVLNENVPALTTVLGAPGPAVTPYADFAAVAAAAWTKEFRTVAILPFEQLMPSLAVYAIDGQNPVENANRFDAATYPLVARVYLHRQEPLAPDQQPLADALLAAIPAANRDPTRLTVLAMTGVTAMCRLTAQQMDENGPDWPAAVVGPELAAADITHISNEVPFVEDCETNISSSNLVFCSKPAYIATLRASGADIIGLTGNHQNDFGKSDALASLAFYEQEGLPVYGGGVNLAAAEAPLYLEHNGNRLAFLGANSYGPDFAWADVDYPGSAPFDLARMSELIATIHREDHADLVLVELQYEESYAVMPLPDQRENFNALVKAGADIVTGVQSHVPQALEFTDGKLILYGLGNLYFDQMWPQSVREGMIVKHTLYQGRHLSTQILTTFLYEYGQPHWATANQRTSILQRVFAASYWE